MQKFRTAISIFHALLIMILLGSCKQPVKPVTKEEAAKFARELQLSIEQRDEFFFDEALDKAELLKRAGYIKRKNNDQAAAQLGASMKLGSTIIKSLSEKGTYQLVKHYEKNNVQHLIFRMYEQGRLNYHDLELLHTDNKVKIGDVYVYTTGENLSETLRMINQQMTEISGKNSFSKDHYLDDISTMKKLVVEEKHEEANEIYSKIPVEVQRIKVMQIVHLLIASGLDSTTYNNALEEYKRYYPNDPASHLMSIDGYFMNKEYAKGLNAVNELDKMINKDPLLDYYRYLFYSTMNDDTQSKECLLRLVKNMPDFQDGYIELILTYADEEKNMEAKSLIRQYKEKKAFDQEYLSMAIAGYPGLKE